MVDLSPILSLDSSERGSLQLALAFCAGFLQVPPDKVAAILSTAASPSTAAGAVCAPIATSDEGATDSTATSERVLHVDLTGARAVKLREKIATALFCEDLRADLVDRATAAIVGGLTQKGEINRLIATAQRSARDNVRRGVGPDRAWLVFYPYLKAIYERNGCAFPKLSGPLEAEPASVREKREEAARLHARVAATLKED